MRIPLLSCFCIAAALLTRATAVLQSCCTSLGLSCNATDVRDDYVSPYSGTHGSLLGLGPSLTVLDTSQTLDGNGCTLDANNTRRCMLVTPGVDVEIVNMTFQRCKMKWADFGGGLLIESATARLDSCTFDGIKNCDYGTRYNNWRCYKVGGETVNDTIRGRAWNGGSIGGGALALKGHVSSGHITACMFAENEALRGGALAVFGDSNNNLLQNNYSLTVEQTRFERNVASDGDPRTHNIFGGAVCLYAPQSQTKITAALRACTFSANSAGEGGAVFAANAGLTTDSCVFSDNKAIVGPRKGGAIRGRDDSSIRVNSCAFIKNQGTEGGALYHQGASEIINVTGSSFVNNTADTFKGGGAYVDVQRSGAGEVFLSDTTFKGNTARHHAGGLFTETVIGPTNVRLRRLVFESNKVEVQGGHTNKGSGGAWLLGEATALSNLKGPVVVHSCKFESNRAVKGAAVLSTGPAAAGAVSADRTFHACVFRANEALAAESKGSVYLADESGETRGVVSLQRCLFQRTPTAGPGSFHKGGLLFLWGTGGGTNDATVDACTFGSVHVTNMGGAIYCNYMRLALNRSVFSSCEAQLSGGAVHFHASITGTSVSGCTFASCNARTDRGGAVNINQHGQWAVIMFRGVVFVRNTAHKHGGAVALKGRAAFHACVFADNVAGISGHSVYAPPLRPLDVCTETSCTGNKSVVQLDGSGAGNMCRDAEGGSDDWGCPDGCTKTKAGVYPFCVDLRTVLPANKQVYVTFNASSLATSPMLLSTTAQSLLASLLQVTCTRPGETNPFDVVDSADLGWPGGCGDVGLEPYFDLSACPVFHACPNRSAAFGGSPGRSAEFCVNNTRGTICPGGSAEPLPCTVGTYQDAATQTVCKSCPAGTFVEQSGAPRCKACPVNWVAASVGSTVCVQCQGETAPPGSSRCASCTESCAPRTEWANASLGALDDKNLCGCQSCSTCPAGHFVVRGCNISVDRSCSVCPGGRYSAGQNWDECESCPAGWRGTTTTPGQQVCVECPPGFATPQAESLTCAACAPGTFATLAARVVCKSCPVGYSWSTTEEGLAITCMSCPAGFATRDSTSLNCTACALGTFVTLTARAKCKVCPSGFAASSRVAAIACIDCPAGRHQPQEGKAACADCAAGKYAEQIRQMVCKECRDGQYAMDSATSECTNCPAGYFRSKAGQSKDAAAAGTTSSSSSSSSSACRPCPLGRYLDNDGGAKCKACVLPGQDKTKYTPMDGTSECSNCAGNAEHTASHASCACKSGTGSGTGLDVGMSSGFYEIGLRLGSRSKDSDAGSGDFASSSSFRYIIPAPSAIAMEADIQGGNLSGTCKPCPSGALCTGTQGRLFVRPGFWKSAGAAQPASLLVLPCRVAAACPGNAGLAKALQKKLEESEGSTYNGGNRSTDTTRSRLASNLTEHDGAAGPCRVGHTGKLCGLCTEEWKPDIHGICISCPKDGMASAAAWGLFIVAASFVVLGVLIGLATYDVGDDDNEHTPGDGKEGHHSRVERAEELLEQAEAEQAEVRTCAAAIRSGMALLPFIQRLSPAGETFKPFDYPPVVMAALNLMSVAYFRVASVMRVVGPCAFETSHLDRLALQIAIVPWLALLCCLAYGIARCKTARQKKKQQQEQQSAQTLLVGGSGALSAKERARLRVRRKQCKTRKGVGVALEIVRTRLLALFIFVLNFAYPGIGATHLASFLCTAVGDKSYLVEDLQLECWTPQHWFPIAALATFGCVALLLGLPAFMAAAVIYDRKFLARMQATAAAEREHAKRRAAGNPFLVAPRGQAWPAEAKGEVEAALDGDGAVAGLAAEDGGRGRHGSTRMLHRIKMRARKIRMSRVRRIAEEQHEAVRFFVGRYRPEMWWYFLQDMILSLIFCAVLALLEAAPEVQITLAFACALVQCLLPAAFRPYAHGRENTIASAGAIVYFVVLLAGLAKLLTRLTARAGDASLATRLAALDQGITILFISGILTLAYVGLRGGLLYMFLSRLEEAAWHRVVTCVRCEFSCSTCSACFSSSSSSSKATSTNSAKVVPLPGPQDGRGPASLAEDAMPRAGAGKEKEEDRQKPKDDKATEESETLRGLPVHLHRATAHALKQCPRQLRQRYVAAWQSLCEAQVQVAAVAVQAIVRGHAMRGSIFVSGESKAAASDAAGTRKRKKLKRQHTLTTANLLLERATDDNARLSKEAAAAKIQASVRGAQLRRASTRHLQLEESLTNRRRSRLLDEAQAKKILESDKEEHQAHLRALELERAAMRGKGKRRLEKRRKRHLSTRALNTDATQNAQEENKGETVDIIKNDQ